MKEKQQEPGVKKENRYTALLKIPLIRNAAGILWILTGLLLFLSLISFNPADQSYNTYSTHDTVKNFCGRPGATVADHLLQAFGYPTYLFVLFSLLIGIKLLKNQPVILKVVKIPGAVFTVIWISVLLSIFGSGTEHSGYSISRGGWIGGVLVESTRHYFSTFWLVIFNTMCIVSSVLMWLGNAAIRYPVELAQELYGVTLRGIEHIKQVIGNIRQKYTGRIPEDGGDDHEILPPIEYEQEEISIEKPKPKPKPKQKSKKKPEAKTRKKRAVQDDFGFTSDDTVYQYPALNLLKESKSVNKKDAETELAENSATLESKLSDFGVDGHVAHVIPGPVITQYEYEPARGIKLNKIINLAEDLALAMRTNFAPRIAHIPGKSVVGVEIPNSEREIVTIKGLIGSDGFQNHDGILKIALGKDTRGNPYITHLESMPHLLVAGATGSGKSVCINSILVSFLYGLSPDELQLLLIDPKMLELSIYNGIPHLREPVVTDPKKAATALEWAVREMEERYNMLAIKGVRNIDQYNRAIQEENAEEPDDEEDCLVEDRPKPLPYLVIIIDELADLMMVASASVENSIARLAQMARAAGIHLILATQRPSVDVLTGFIKANFPCRIAFQVSSKVDSRTILDMNGAEKLLGKGDMLFIPPGASREKRVHGAFVSENEIKLLVQFLKKSVPPRKKESIFKIYQPKQTQEHENDELYNEAVEIVVLTGQASISMLQRRLRVGHSRAARLIDMMEQAGIVGPFEGSKPRKILIEKEELESLLNSVHT